jgi:uncharacterized membrane protein
VELAVFLTIGAAIWGLAIALPRPEGAGALLAFQLTVGFGMLLGPILVHSFVATSLTRRAVTKVGTKWCAERSVEFIKVEMHKNHFTVVYVEADRKQRAKFRVKFVPTTWSVREVTWL